MTAARHRVIEAGFRAIGASRADRWLRPLAQGRGVILTFHHVHPDPPGAYAPNRLLTITPAFLEAVILRLEAKGFDIVALDELPARLHEDGAPFAVLTFDDGYRDNLEHAAPILARHELPWTLFVTSEFAEGRGRLWWIELERAIARLDRIRLAPSADAAEVFDHPARDAREKETVFAALYRHLRAGGEDHLLAHIAALSEEAGQPTGRVAAELCLSWSELRVLAADPSVTIGAHTVSHPMLAKHGEDAVVFEIAEGRRRIEGQLGAPVRHLSYPVGDRTSAASREFALSERLGFATAVTTRPGHLFAGHARHLHALPRVSINGLYQSEAALDALLSGVPFLAWNRFRRLDVA
ncbi:MAG: polysaccharide deacetylase family protein [Methylobacterium sp.]|uniref:polysaccharide deacetylase family protein n=1 Tax=Methylobacterium sp. TaxID=409 RepID=UPI0025EF96EF|nr:polysaccharide deacetylase family protein [Methylobacterium sp.]MBX9930989.1 polysaccharide deacetylase family protein [Methylobacterium sp.]